MSDLPRNLQEIRFGQLIVYFYVHVFTIYSWFQFTNQKSFGSRFQVSVIINLVSDIERSTSPLVISWEMLLPRKLRKSGVSISQSKDTGYSERDKQRHFSSNVLRGPSGRKTLIYMSSLTYITFRVSYFQNYPLLHILGIINEYVSEKIIGYYLID